jgi:hypothetical protein
MLLFHLGQNSEHLVIVQCSQLDLGVVVGFDVAELVAGVVVAALDADKLAQELGDLLVEGVSPVL